MVEGETNTYPSMQNQETTMIYVVSLDAAVAKSIAPYTSTRHLVIVYHRVPPSLTKSTEILMQRDVVRVDLVPRFYLEIDLINHAWVPKFTVITEHPPAGMNYHIMSTSDPVAVLHGWTPGTYVKAFRSSCISGSSEQNYQIQ